MNEMKEFPKKMRMFPVDVATLGLIDTLIKYDIPQKQAIATIRFYNGEPL